MADIIKLLPDHVANQIAAGEVVQRPASVVKELLENAIDAKSEIIKLIIKDGGKALIQVVDDGMGMSTTDARLSFERHATSKIAKADDLFNLHTKGFRGEALASIAAIAHVDMQTRSNENELGTQLRIEGSKVTFQEPCATPKGTSIAIKNLFFNIPARRNFLKSNQVELRHITDEFHRVVLAHPNVEFRFFNNGHELFNLPKSNLRKRISNVFGNRMTDRLVPTNEKTEVVKISGFVCKPEFAKKSRGEQFFFANGRFIKSPYLHYAVVSAFEGLIKPDTHPGYFLYLEVNPSSIDINIHPTKTEVKFDDEHTLYAMLRSAVKHALGHFNVAPVLDFERDPNLDTPYTFNQKEAILPKISVDRAFNPFEQQSQGSSNMGKASVKGWESLYEGIELESMDSFSSIEFESESEVQKTLDQEFEETHATTTLQLQRKYIVSTVKSGLLVIDQSRAHQRVLFERFLGEITVKEGVSQQLLFPIEMQFSKPELQILSEIKSSLVNIGFVFEAIKSEKVKLTGIPLLMGENDITPLFDQILADYQQGRSEQTITQAELLATILSKNMAIKNGEVLAPESQMALVNDLFRCKEPMLTPFRKMTYCIMAHGDIEKRFM